MEKCTSSTKGDGQYVHRNLNCQLPLGHSGQCSYHRLGGQGGSLITWWGANSQPVGDMSNATYQGLRVEIWRLRGLLDANGIDWKAGWKSEHGG